MKLAVIGSRGFNDYGLLKETLEQYKGVEQFISGGARGADLLGERWARENNIPTKIFKPDWDKHGKAAGFIRNKDIISNADLVIAFWDGVSKGTQHSINLAKDGGKELIIIMI
jgi:hypothetical protein